MGEHGVPQDAVVRVGLRRVGLLELVRSDEALRGCALLRTLGAAPLGRLLGAAVARRYGDQAPVFQEGEPPRALYLVLQGEARVCTLRAGEAVEVAVVARGDFFGEAELVDASPVRRQSAVAHGGVGVAELPAGAVAEAARACAALEALLRGVAQARQRAGSELCDFLNRW